MNQAALELIRKQQFFETYFRSHQADVTIQSRVHIIESNQMIDDSFAEFQIPAQKGRMRIGWIVHNFQKSISDQRRFRSKVTARFKPTAN